MNNISSRSLLISAAIIGGAVFLAIQLRMALGLNGAPAAGPESSSRATARSADSSGNPWIGGGKVAWTADRTRSVASSPATMTAAVEAESAPATPSIAVASEDDGAEEVKACAEGIEKAHKLAAALPADDLSRYFAERYLQQARAEAGNGETDECQQFVEQATDEVTEHRHTLAPGEKLNILRADEMGG